MPIEAVIFDIGDVLEVNPRTGWRARWARRLQLELAAFERRLDEVWAPGSVGASSLEEIEAQTASALGLEPAELAALMDDAWSEYVGSLNRELADYFIGLRPRYKTGILSNSFVGAREREEEAHGFAEMCDVIVYSHEEGYLKPDARIYRIVCDRLGVAPHAAVLLDDVQGNVDGARAAGMRAITFTDNRRAIAKLGALLTD
ncbi:MAG: HAD family phosphatase [Solirubrobacterales bacterium]|nr:HAD family phosphatase [Solirubrobacterales bacterium]MBV9715496.1 HAD family phosphatase [Solirubrobacterales bacterium]